MALEIMAKATTPIPLDLAFRVEAGELLALVGHSGSGKTTLLRTIAGLWRPEAARVQVNGRTWLDTAAGVDLPTHQRRVGVVFQHYALFPHMTAAQNVASAIDHLSGSAKQLESERLLELVNLSGLGPRKPSQLSGGEQQRVAVARSLARRPEALLLDEPFSAVDRSTREKLHAEVIALRAHLAMPVVLVTHDMNEAQLLADRMVVIDGGRMVAEGSTGAVMSNPEALHAMGIREAAAMLVATVDRHDADGMTRLITGAGPLWLPKVEAAPGARVRVRIMAHEVMLARSRPEGLSAQNILPARIVDLQPGDGPAVLIRLALGEDEILARVTRRAVAALNLAAGDQVHAILKSMSIARDHINAG
ncbi:MAG: molybdenum ABC transporter ATP-binding protein [Gammaproteobacteria bacterium]|nr:molybdenum ABC transporter ATP-binding protein [Gammaproteobacteria bacterium]